MVRFKPKVLQGKLSNIHGLRQPARREAPGHGKSVRQSYPSRTQEREVVGAWLRNEVSITCFPTTLQSKIRHSPGISHNLPVKYNVCVGFVKAEPNSCQL